MSSALSSSSSSVSSVSALIPGKCYFLLVFNGMDRFLYNWIFFTWVGGGDEKLLSVFNACLLYSVVIILLQKGSMLNNTH